MKKINKSAVSKEYIQSTGGFGGAIYDWDVLLDGNFYELESGVDFTCKESAFKAVAALQAGKRKLRIEWWRKSDGKGGQVKGVLVIHAREATPEEQEDFTRRMHQRKVKAAQRVLNGEASSQEAEEEEYEEVDA